MTDMTQAQTAPVVAIGECMVEFFRRSDGAWQQGFAGDTLNTLWALRALLPNATPCAYLTRIGMDRFSQAMLGFLKDAGIETGLVGRDGARQPGLYTIETDEAGERSFTYWRSASAARALADDPAALTAALSGARLAYVSGITLAILPPEGRRALLECLRTSAATCVFDPNIRPALWESADAAREWITQAAQVSDIALPSHDDEAVLFGDADCAASARRYADLGVGIVVAKDGERAVHLCENGQIRLCDVAPVAAPVDTTGAGDAFNGGFLAGWLCGQTLDDAVAQGQRVAAAVIAERGALISPQVISRAAADGSQALK